MFNLGKIIVLWVDKPMVLSQNPRYYSSVFNYLANDQPNVNLNLKVIYFPIYIAILFVNPLGFSSFPLPFMKISCKNITDLASNLDLAL